MLALDPGFGFGRSTLGRTLMAKQMHPEAIREYEAVLDQDPGQPRVMAYLADAYAISGNRNGAQRILGEMIEQSRRDYFPPLYVAIALTALNERDQAFQWLGKALGARDEGLFWLCPKVNPLFDPLRSDPRYAQVLEKMRLAP